MATIVKIQVRLASPFHHLAPLAGRQNQEAELVNKEQCQRELNLGAAGVVVVFAHLQQSRAPTHPFQIPDFAVVRQQRAAVPGRADRGHVAHMVSVSVKTGRPDDETRGGHPRLSPSRLHLHAVLGRRLVGDHRAWSSR